MSSCPCAWTVLCTLFKWTGQFLRLSHEITIKMTCSHAVPSLFYPEMVESILMSLSKILCLSFFVKVVDITICYVYVCSELLWMCSVDNVCTFPIKHTCIHIIFAEMLRKFDGILHDSTFSPSNYCSPIMLRLVFFSRRQLEEKNVYII